MQSSRPSKKSLKKEEERPSETVPVSEAPKTRSSRTSKTPKEKVQASSAKVHRTSPVTSAVRAEANDPGPAKVMAATAGAGVTNGGIVDSVGVVAASSIQEAPVSNPAVQSKGLTSKEEIARLAYSYWESRGFSHGLADEDWIRAEAELLARG